MSIPIAAKDLQRRARRSRQALLIGICVSFLLALLKIGAGLYGRSMALIADGIESCLDMLSSAFLLGALFYAQRPPDRRHPYGHGKAESLAAGLGAVILIVAGIGVGWTSLRRIFLADGPPAVPEPFTLVVLLLVVAVKEILFRILLRHSLASGSTALKADAWHHRSDAVSSLAAAVGISIALIGGPRFAQADSWAALVCCIIIIAAGLRMFREALAEVMDERVSAELEEKALRLVCNMPGVLSAEKCRMRKSGMSLLLDIHIRVDGNETVRRGHAISHEVKDALLRSGMDITDVTVHIEPEEETS